MVAAEPKQVDARIVYWGIEGAGVLTNLRAIHAKLRADHRGELRQLPTRLDPSATYPMLPIELGQVRGVRTRLQIIGMPPGPDRVAARKQLLDRIDGLVLVIDSQPDKLDENLSSYDELRQSLSSYGRSLSTLPVVVQYNKRDLAGAFDIESLHRKLDLRDAAVFEAVASEGTGVLQTLTTISKRVVRILSERQPAESADSTELSEPAELINPTDLSELAERAAQLPSPALALGSLETLERPAPSPAALPERNDPTSLENAILLDGERADAGADPAAEATLLDAQHALDRPWSELEQEVTGSSNFRIADLRILEVGTATIAGPRSVSIPLTLANPEGERARLSLTIALDALPEPEE